VARNYRKEYDEYHGTDEQKKNRASRNAARRDAVKKHGKAKLRGKEVDHKDGNPKNNGKKNLQIISRSDNRKKGG
jgi:hypothetical protein